MVGSRRPRGGVYLPVRNRTGPGPWRIGDEKLEEISHRDIEEYCDTLDEGREYRPSYEEV